MTITYEIVPRVYEALEAHGGDVELTITDIRLNASNELTITLDLKE